MSLADPVPIIPKAAETPALNDDHPNKPINRSLIRPNTPTLRRSTALI